MNSELNKELEHIIEPIIEPKTLHPCINCNKNCMGKQCRDCHIKMLNSECIDCNRTFNARRKNGTMRKRCLGCQTDYNKKYVRKCPECNSEFHDLSNKYSVCLPCYKNQQENKKLEYEKIKTDREAIRKDNDEINKNKWENSEKKECYTHNCYNITIYKFCKKCYDMKNDVNKRYMTYICQDCGYRGIGDYNLCIDCNNKK